MLNKYIFIAIAAIVDLVLFAFIIKILRKKIKSNKSILISMMCGFLDIPIYCHTVLSQDYRNCYIAFTLNLILVEWLTFYFLKFVSEFSFNGKKVKRFFKVLFLTSLLDSLLLCANIFFGYMFEITLDINKIDYQRYYWIISYKPYAILHFILSYFYIISTLSLLFRLTYRAASFYKMRYIGILVVYIVVVSVHAVCQILHINTDFSILLYGMMGAFVSHYITYAVPNQLLYQVLQCYSETADDAIVYLDEKGHLLLINKKARKLFTRDGNYSPEAAEEYCSNVVLRYVKVKHEVTFFKDSMIIGGEIFDFEGEYREFYDKRNPIGAFLRLENKTLENIRYKKQQYLANNDPLTGIYNREYFFSEVDSIIKKDPYTPRLMICSNVFDFKLINEILGTDFGDTVLKKIASLISRLSRADDLYCRICDDKFAVFMRKNLFDPQVFSEAFKVIQRLTESELFQIKIGIGIYEAQGERESGQVMYDKAFLALNKMDKSSKQNFHFYDSAFMEHIIEEKNMVSIFDDELSKNKFKLYLSPIKNQKDEVFAVETCSKWLHSEKGLLNSDEYLPILEKYGIVYKLDRYIWEESIKWLSEYNKKYNSNLKLLLQVSVKDSFYIDILETLLELTHHYDCNPNVITVEFLEESISYDFRYMNDLFSKMQKNGFRILFNKFGNGHSSLNLLKETHIDGVKIDSKFINDSDDDEKSRKILEFIISLSNMLELNPCISGVNSHQQFEFLRKLNIKGYQGLYCGEDMTPEQFCADFYN